MILGRSSLAYKLITYSIDFKNVEVETRELLPANLIPNIYISSNQYKIINEYKEAIKGEYYDEFETLETNYNLLTERIEKVARAIKSKIDPNNLYSGSIGFLEYACDPRHVDISIVDNDKLDIEAFKNWRPEYKNDEFILEADGSYICGHEVEKMSKSKFNVQTPDELIEKFGADTLRMYEMFLGPLEQSKHWDTKGIGGVHNFLRKLWRLFHDQEGNLMILDDAPSADSLRTLHKTIQKITND